MEKYGEDEMKYFLKSFIIFSLLAPLFIGELYSQTDSIYATVQGETAAIWHTQTYRNCASKFLMDAQLEAFHITLMEIDTIGPIANCLCYFDLSVEIGPLASGDYLVDIFGIDVIYGDTTYFGSTSFSIANTLNPLSYQIISQYQSECYNLTKVDHPAVSVPNEFEFPPVYPNPFNPITNIRYELPKSGHIELSIYDLRGQKIITLLNRNISSGEHNIKWDGSNYSSGIYFVLIKFENVIKIQKALLTK